jgi:tetratricopeptide (TPR) repeat protein
MIVGVVNNLVIVGKTGTLEIYPADRLAHLLSVHQQSTDIEDWNKNQGFQSFETVYRIYFEARDAAARDDLVTAVADLHTVVRACPAYWPAFYTAVGLAVESGDRELTDTLCEEWAAKGARQDLRKLSRGYAMAKRGEYTPALALFEEANAERSSSTSLVYSANTLMMLHRNDEAKAKLQALVRMEPKSYEPWRALYVLADSERSNEAAARAAAEWQQRCWSDEPVIARAMALQGAGRIDEAQGVLEEGRKQFPMSARIVAMSGWVVASQKDYNTAIALLRRAHEMEPLDAEIAVSFARVLVKQKEWRSAIVVLRPFAESESSNLDVYQLLVSCARTIKDEETEKRTMEHLKKVDSFEYNRLHTEDEAHR